MIPAFVLTNLASWFVQVVLVATAGAALPLLLRIRHPRSQLAYIHAVLGLCLLLPLIQTWQESLTIVAGNSFQDHREVAAVSWSTVAVWLLLAGIIGKLGWLGVGFYQLRRYRKSAVALCPLPESVREARHLTRADALFGISRSISGPATLGHIDPIVLLPESFLSLDAESQRSIACHELLHVQRRDWLVTVLEEIVGALLWFNPGVWWMLSQARLAREQLVDSEVVNITAREPYIEALLSMAVVSRKRWALPAASFFTQGHLMDRMRLLVKGPNRSLLRLCVSYTAVVILLVAAISTVILSFPLTSKSVVVLAAKLERSITVRATDPPNRVVQRVRLLKEFTIAVPPPPDGNNDVMYFVHQGSLVEPEGTLRIPPPPPPFPGSPGGFGFLGVRGIRMVRPGEVATPEEIQRLREAFGGRAEVEIDQAENGVVKRVSVRPKEIVR
jgi:beta-lactamase regulating signal transducer with metallopeptidase domain